MAYLNRVMLIGNLTRDPELRFVGNNQAVADFGMACNRKYKTAAGEDREEVVYVDCTAWGKAAEIINEHCKKGKQLFLDGRLKLDQWEDKTTGDKRSKLTVTVENFQFLGAKGDVAADEEHDQRRPPAKSGASRGGGRAPSQRPPREQQSDDPFDSADIPFLWPGRDTGTV